MNSFEIDADKYTLRSLEVIFQQSNEYIADIHSSTREVVNKSYIALAVYGSISAKLIYDTTGQHINFISILLILLSFVPIILLVWNISPKTKTMAGYGPKNICNPLLETYKGKEQYLIIMASLINANALKIELESPVLNKVSRWLKISIYAELLFLAVLVLRILLC